MEEYGISMWIVVTLLLTCLLLIEISESVIERSTSVSLVWMIEEYRFLLK